MKVDAKYIAKIIFKKMGSGKEKKKNAVLCFSAEIFVIWHKTILPCQRLCGLRVVKL